MSCFVQLFDKLRSVKPDFLDSIEIVTGDMSEPELGIDETTRGVLTNEVQIVFHSAATVNLTANLKTSTAINVKGTRDMCRLCAKFRNLQVSIKVLLTLGMFYSDEILLEDILLSIHRPADFCHLYESVLV